MQTSGSMILSPSVSQDWPLRRQQFHRFHDRGISFARLVVLVATALTCNSAGQLCLGADSVATGEYHGRIGDVIRIGAYSLFKVDKVLVAIRAEKAGLIDCGLARLDPATNQTTGPGVLRSQALLSW